MGCPFRVLQSRAGHECVKLIQETFDVISQRALVKVDDSQYSRQFELRQSDVLFWLTLYIVHILFRIQKIRAEILQKFYLNQMINVR